MPHSPRSVAVLVNPSAGGTTTPDIVDTIAAAFDTHGIEPRMLTFRPGDDVAALARKGAATAEVVVAAGGDGTVSAVAGVVAGTEVALGVLPVGTLNHFAKDLNLPLALPDAIATIAAGRIHVVDAAQVNGRLFVNNSSIGVYPNAVEIREELRGAGHNKWMAMAIASWRVVRTYRGLHVRLTVNGQQRLVRTPFVFVGNNEYQIEGLKAGTREHLGAGQLFIYLAPRITTRELPMLVLGALAGRVAATRAFEVIAAEHLTIDTIRGRHVVVSLDGETAPLRLPLRYQTRPGALRVIV